MVVGVVVGVVVVCRRNILCSRRIKLPNVGLGSALATALAAGSAFATGDASKT